MADTPLSASATCQSVPPHVAIVMDGNGRWAKKRFLPRVAGHKQGVDALRHTVQSCVDRGVRVLTVFAFSSENWNRPVEEVKDTIRSETDGFVDEPLVEMLATEAPRGEHIYFHQA